MSEKKNSSNFMHRVTAAWSHPLHGTKILAPRVTYFHVVSIVSCWAGR